MAESRHGRAAARPAAAIVLALALALAAGPGRVRAQGVTTAAISGEVRTADGAGADGARVAVTNVATGVVVETVVRRGRFLAAGLPVGGPYVVAVRRVGFRPERRGGIVLALGAFHELRLVLYPLAESLDTLRVVAEGSRPMADGGAATVVSEDALRRMPTLDRNLYDFALLAPQLSAKVGLAAGGLSAGGVGFRLNDYLLDGVSQRSIGGHVPPEFAGARSVPLDAVREYQILVTPFDVRHGDFAGALVNAVTRSGTNRVEGSAFAQGRSDALARGGAAPYERVQYGLSVGGPLRRDRLHYFAAAELQRFDALAPGPYLGAPASAGGAPVSAADAARLRDVLGGYGLRAGSAGPVENRNPLGSLFVRLDGTLPRWRSRAGLSVNATDARLLAFSRAARDAFPLSTNAATQVFTVRHATLRLHTTLRRAGGGHNDAHVSARTGGTAWDVAARQPLVRVRVPRPSGGTVMLVAGPPEHAHGAVVRGSALSIGDELTLPIGGAHVASVGVRAERFRLDRAGVANAYGTWTFSSLDSLAAGRPERFTRERPPERAGASLVGGHYAAYVGDRWRPGERVVVTLGVRAEVLALHGRAPYVRAVDSIYGRRTDRPMRRDVHLSPRAGFTLALTEAGRDRLRGGAGVFTGRPPGAWLHAPRYNYGRASTLACGRLRTDMGPPPAFAPAYDAPPSACGEGAGPAEPPRAAVDLADPGLRMARTLRGVLGYDRALPAGAVGTLEAVLTRGLDAFVFANLNLVGPQGVDRHGRVLYGTIGASGAAAPAERSRAFDVFELRNSDRSRAAQVSARLERGAEHGTWLAAHYTFSRVRDAQTPLRVNVRSALNWGARAVSGRHNDPRAGVSLNDVPHRIVLAAARRAPWRRWPTELAVLYVGESGSPFTYVAWGAGIEHGDLNADGSNANDPVYVPRRAADTAEIRLAPLVRRGLTPSGEVRMDTVTVAQQAEALERRIARTPCLRRQRGRILAPNSCREPWSNVTVASLRQQIPLGARALELRVDAFDLLALFGPGRGRYRVANPALLEHVGQTRGAPGASQPIFRYDPTSPRWTVLPAESTFQLQLAARYRL